MWRFQSTLPVWGATAWTPWHSCELSYFNPRSPCGERPVRVIMSSMIHMHFNPRSPCGERLKPSVAKPWNWDFNPRSPCGERRPPEFYSPWCHNFNPRSPCGERLSDEAAAVSTSLFQSTLPVWGATVSSYQYSRLPPTFQSTLPVWGATTFAQRLPLPHFDFNPRSPCGERRAGQSNPVYPTGDFNPRSPCGERPGRRRSSILTEAISIHAPRVGSDLRTISPA